MFISKLPEVKITHSDQPGQQGNRIRFYLFPRKHQFEVSLLPNHGFNAAFCELAGHIVVLDEEKYSYLTEEEVVAGLEAISLSSSEFNHLKEVIVEKVTAETSVKI